MPNRFKRSKPPTKFLLRDSAFHLANAVLEAEIENLTLKHNLPARQKSAIEDKVVNLNIFAPNARLNIPNDPANPPDAPQEDRDNIPPHNWASHRAAIALDDIQDTSEIITTSIMVAQALMQRVALLYIKAQRHDLFPQYKNKNDFYFEQVKDRASVIQAEVDRISKLYSHADYYDAKPRYNVTLDSMKARANHANGLVSYETISMLRAQFEFESDQIIERHLKYNTINLSTRCIMDAADAYHGRILNGIKAIKCYDGYQLQNFMSSRRWHDVMDMRLDCVHSNIKDTQEARWLLLLGQTEISALEQENGHKLLGRSKKSVAKAEDFYGYQRAILQL